MRKFNLISREDGQVLPLVAIILSVVLLGFAALVVDTGFLYAERKTMVTAADAAALAGAMEMRDGLGGNKANAQANAIATAKEIALANGVKNANDVVVEIGEDSNHGGRDTITVTVKNNKDLIFARFLGSSDSDVAGRAVATWGYVKSLLGGNILPIFGSLEDFETGEPVYIHDGKLMDPGGNVVNSHWGLLDLGVQVKKAFSGELIKEPMEIGLTVDGKQGEAGGHVDAIEERMQKANGLDTIKDRQRFMSGLVPIVDWDRKIDIGGNKLRFPIEYFAVFEIFDVITAPNSSKHKAWGSEHALHGRPNYKSDGNQIKYDPINGEYLEKNTIIGGFTGEIIELDAVVDPNDQNESDFNEDAAKYHKLIE